MYKQREVSLLVLLIATIAVIAHPAISYGYMQDTKNPKPSVPAGQFPLTRNTGTARAMTPITSKLMVFTVNGGGTTVTKTNGEFGSTLAASATVGKEFALQWTRTKPGKAEKGSLYITPPNSTAWVGVQNVTMPAESTSLNIQYSVPNLAPNTYELMVAGESGNSTKVTITYNGQGSNGTSIVIKPGPAPGKIAASKGKIIAEKFTPVVGSPNEPGYKNATLSLTLEAESDWQIKEISVEVYSQPFMNSEVVTASGSKNAPIKLFLGTWKTPSATFTIHPGAPKVLLIQLHRTSKGQVNEQETGPGIYSPADWKIAFAQTTTASFRWSVDGKQYGSAEQSPKNQWQQQ